MNWSDLNYEIKKDLPDSILISTFNFWTAFTNWRGHTVLPPIGKMSSLQEFLCLMGKTKIGGVIVITPPRDHIKRITNEITFLKKKLPNIRYIIHDHNHSKMIIFGHIIGNDFNPDRSRIWNSSRNFHQSEMEQYHEITTEVVRKNEKEECLNLFLELINEGEEL